MNKFNNKKINFKKKTISPIISILLLVAIVVILMGVFFSWSQTRSLGILEETKEETGRHTGLIACMDADFVISNISINSITKEITFKVENKSKIDLINPSVTIIGKEDGEKVSYFGRFKETIKGGHIVFLSTQKNDFSFEGDISHQDLPLEIDIITIIAENCPQEIMEFRVSKVDYKGIVGWWKFDEGEGTIVYDHSGNENHGSFSGTPNYVKSPLGYAMEFMYGQQINIPHSDSLTFDKEMSAVAVVKVNDFDYESTNGGLISILRKGSPDTVNPHSGFWFRLDNRNSFVRHSYTCFGNTNGGHAGGGNNFPANTYNYNYVPERYYHIAISIQENYGRFYIDGVQIGPDRQFNNLDLNSLATLAIGNITTNSINQKITIDSIRLYNTSLSSEEISFLYEQTKNNYEQTTIKIDNPKNGTNYFINSEINFKSSVYYLDKDYQCNWTSSIDGLFIEDNCDADYSSLSLGEHTITLEVITSEKIRTATTNISIIERPIPSENLILYLDASAIEGLNDGDKISEWLDFSGNNNHATQATEANRPTYKTDILNGKPAIRFNGVSSFLNVPSLGISGSQDRTIFIVASYDETLAGSDNQFFSFNSDSSTNTQRYSLRLDGDSDYFRIEIQGDFAVSNLSHEEDSFFVFTSVLNGTTIDDITFFVNGESDNLVSNNSLTINTIDENNRIGRYLENRYLKGHISEIIIYDYALSLKEISEIEKYLGEKWLGYDPTVPQKVLHLDASAIEGKEDGDKIETWQDLSGNNNHATQATEANKPIYKTDILNGKPVIRFDKTSDNFLSFNLEESISQPLTIFKILKFVPLIGDSTNVYNVIDSGTGTTERIQFNRQPDDYWRIFSGINIDFEAQGYDDRFIMSSLIFDSSDSKCWFDGSLFCEGNSGSNKMGGVVNIGARNDHETGYYFNGDIAEIIIYDRALTDEERQDVEQYLTDKWFE